MKLAGVTAFEQLRVRHVFLHPTFCWDILRLIAQHQIIDGTEVELPYSSHFNTNDWMPMRALLIHGTTELLELVVSEPEPRSYTRVLVRPEEIENSGDNILYAGVKDEKINIPLDIWLFFVAPQCTFERARDIPGYLAWEPEAGTYHTVGTIWSAQSGAVVSRVRRDAPPYVVKKTDGRISGRDAQIYLYCLNDPPVQSLGAPICIFSRWHGAWGDHGTNNPIA